jgi:hypothetical protein
VDFPVVPEDSPREREADGKSGSLVAFMAESLGADFLCGDTDEIHFDGESQAAPHSPALALIEEYVELDSGLRLEVEATSFP